MDYDRWQPPAAYDYDMYNPEERGYVHESELPNLEDVKEAIRGIIDALYVTGDVYGLENCLYDLCIDHKIDFQLGTPKIQKKQTNWEGYLWTANS